MVGNGDMMVGKNKKLRRKGQIRPSSALSLFTDGAGDPAPQGPFLWWSHPPLNTHTHTHTHTQSIPGQSLPANPPGLLGRKTLPLQTRSGAELRVVQSQSNPEHLESGSKSVSPDQQLQQHAGICQNCKFSAHPRYSYSRGGAE